MSIQTTFTYVNPATLSIDPSVQRPLNPARVAELVGNFDNNLVGTIIVSQRADGSRIVLDGQTRLAAKAKTGAPGDVHAQVHKGLTLEQEATIFLAYNNSKPVQVLDKFLVRVVEGDPTANAINAILAAHGWTVRKGGGDGNIQSVNALERAYVSGGGSGARIVGSVMNVITEAWGHQSAAVHASLIGGIAELFLRYGEQIDQQKLVRELQNTNPRSLLGRARGIKESRWAPGSLSQIMGSVLHTMYNNKMRRNALGDWK